MATGDRSLSAAAASSAAGITGRRPPQVNQEVGARGTAHMLSCLWGHAEVRPSSSPRLSRYGQMLESPTRSFIPQVISEIATTVLDKLAEGQAQRAGVPIDVLFPFLSSVKQAMLRMPARLAMGRNRQASVVVPS